MNNRFHSRVWMTVLFVTFIAQLIEAQTSWQWQNPLPQGDNIAQIQFVNATRGWIVVGSKNLLHTSDGGQTWQLIPSNISLRRISFIDENRGWGIGSDHPFTYHAGVYQTTDGGRTWEHQYTDSLWGPFVDITFTDLRNGWALGQGFLRHTRDGGVTWQPQTASVSAAGWDIRLSFRDSLRGWIGGRPFFTNKTFDGGQIWVRDSSLEGYNRFLFVDSLHGWASSTFESWTRRMIARTTDGGLTWFQTPSPLRALAFPISETDCIAFGDSGVYRTTNAGSTWMLISQPPTDDGCTTCRFWDGFVQSASLVWAFRPSNSSYYQSTDAGFTWTNRRIDMLSPGYTFLNAVDFVDSLYGWTVGATFRGGPPRDEFVARTTDGGLTWTKIATGLLSEPLAVSFVSRTTGWITGRSGVIRKTTNGGFTWQQQVSGTSLALWGVQFLDSLHGFTVGAALPGQGGGVVKKTTNGGEDWLDVTPAGVGGLGSVQFVDSLFGWIGGSSVFMRTTDGGTTWINPISDPSMRIDGFCFIDRTNGWAKGHVPENVNFHRILKTTDGGSAWTTQLVDSANGGLSFGGVAFYDSLCGWVVGGGGTMWYTTTGGQVWINQTGRTSRLITDIALAGENKAWVVGDPAAILMFAGEKVVSVREQPIMQGVERMQVFPNYPNPFNAQTTLAYRLPNAGEVTFEIYDILGRLVNKIYEGHRSVGEHALILKAEGMTSGIYFYKLSAGEQHQWGKIILIR